MTKYKVQFKVYQYNSGRADNGTFTQYMTYNTLEEAQAIKKLIDRVYNKENYSEEEYEIIQEIIYELAPQGGFLESGADIYITSETKI